MALILSLVGAPGQPARATTVSFTAEELLGKPTDTSITINIVPASTIEYSYRYGTTKGGPYPNMTTPVTATGGQPHEVTITGLAPNTRYYYQMVYDGDGDVDDGDFETRPEHSFWTQRAEGSTFKFAVISDSHATFNSAHQTTMTNILNDQPDFLLDLGDTFYPASGTTTQAAVNNAYLAYREPQYMDRVGHSVPIYLTPGNHEEEEGWNLDDTPFSIGVGSIQARKAYFPTPTNDGFYSGNIDPLAAIDEATYGDEMREDYYAWTWGDALFVVIDVYQYTPDLPYTPAAGEGTDDAVTGNQWSWTLGKTQYDWLKATLENSDARYKFVFSHHVLGGINRPIVGVDAGYVRGGAEAAAYYEWGGHNADGTWGFDTQRPGWGGVPIHQLFIDNGVSAYFHGHDHQYVYEKRDGIVYQEVPSPSMTGSGFSGIYTEGTYADYETIEMLPNTGHLRITVSPDQATVDYVRSNITGVSHTYTIAPNGPPSGEPPVVSDIPDQTIAEGGSFTSINLDSYVSDADTPDADITWSASGNNDLTVSIVNRIATVNVPSTNWTGSETITFQAHDDKGNYDTDDATFTVTNINDHPVITEGASIGVTMSEDGSPTAFGLTLHATDGDGDTLTWSVSTQASNGTASAAGTGSSKAIGYAPNANYNGADSFGVRVSDGKEGTDTITVNVTIQAINDAPAFTKGADQFVDEDAGAQTVSGWATAINDGDPELTQVLTFNVTGNTNPALFLAGPTVSAANGNLTYTPAANASGNATITLTLSDNGNGAAPNTNTSPPETFVINVTPVNDAPVANGQLVSTDENVPVAITLSASDVDGDLLTYMITSGPSHGTLSGTPPNMTYAPDTHYSGEDSFTFKVNDGELDSAVATVNISIGAVNEAPVANGQSVTTPEDTARAVILTASDGDGDALTYSVVTEPTHGELSGTAPNLTYTPAENYNGPDSFTFKANDGIADSNTARVEITITAVNDAPVLGLIGNHGVDELVQLKFNATATDVEEDSLTYSLVDAPPGAGINTTTGAFSWTPSEIQGPGSYRLEVCASDGSLSDCETITITVEEVNAAPVLNPIGMKEVVKNNPLKFTATATDNDYPANPLAYSLEGAPMGAEINPTTGDFVWEPGASQETGDYTFEVCVSDGGLMDCETITVTVLEERFEIFMPMMYRAQIQPAGKY